MVRIKEGIWSSIFQAPLKIIKDNEDEMEVVVECPYCHSRVKYGETIMISGYIGCPHCYWKKPDGLLETVLRLKCDNDPDYEKGDFYKKGYLWKEEK